MTMEEIIEEDGTIETNPQFGRVKGAQWFSLFQTKSVMVLGQGGIGSWVTLFLARAGIKIIATYDDDLFEEHNLTGQFVGQRYIGYNKADAVAEMVGDLSPSTIIAPNEIMYDQTQPGSFITICGFDNMTARKVAFQKWKKVVNTIPESDRKLCFFQDGRLLSEQLQIFNIGGHQTELMDLYEKEYLFDDSEVEEASCTFKQTTHCAAMIASTMVGFLTNYITMNEGNMFRKVPFYYEYIVPLNKTNKID